MAATLPNEITVESHPDGSTIYQFPVRDWGNWIWLFFVPIVFMLIATVFMVFWTQGFVGGVMQVFGPWGAIAGVATLPFVCGMLMIGCLTLAAWTGRSSLVVHNHEIAAVEQIGWYRYTRRFKREDITRLRVQAGVTGKATDTPSAAEALHHLSVLSAERTSGKPALLVIGYPQDWLVALANELSSRLAVDTAMLDAPPRHIPVDVLQPAHEIDRDEQPAGSVVDLQAFDRGFVFTVPAPGVWNGSSGLFTFALVWCTFMTVFTSAFVFLGFDAPHKDPIARWMFPLFITVFWAVGIGILLGAINMGRRQAAIAVTGEQLKLIVSGLFGTTRREWALGDLKTFRKGPSGIEVNDVPVMQLQIVPHTGAPYGLLTGRDEAEIEWIATHLRRVLRTEEVQSRESRVES